MKKGFTLIEVLTVSSIMVLLTVVIIGLFLAMVRGSTKSTVIQKVKQNGDFALETMARTIRGAEQISVCNVDMSEITVTDKNKVSTTFSLADDKIFNGINDLTSDTVEVTALEFDCYQRELGVKVINIIFALKQAEVDNQQAQEVFEAEFKTSVSTRTY